MFKIVMFCFKFQFDQKLKTSAVPENWLFFGWLLLYTLCALWCAICRVDRCISIITREMVIYEMTELIGDVAEQNERL